MSFNPVLSADLLPHTCRAHSDTHNIRLCRPTTVIHQHSQSHQLALSTRGTGQRTNSSSNWAASSDSSVCSPATVQLDSIQDGRFSVSGSLDTSLSIDTVWGVITDYERLSEVYSNIEHCRLQHRAGTFETSLFMTEERGANRLSFNLAKPSMFMRSFQGRWQLTPQPGGGCCVNHHLSVEPSVAPPAFLDSYTEKIFIAQIEGLLADLRQELERLRLSAS